MTAETNRIREEARRFLAGLQGDERSDVERTLSFLLRLQKSRVLPPPPLAEIVTILKYERPLLHSLLRRRLVSNFGLSILFQLEIDYNLAKQSLAEDVLPEEDG